MFTKIRNKIANFLNERYVATLDAHFSKEYGNPEIDEQSGWVRVKDYDYMRFEVLTYLKSLNLKHGTSMRTIEQGRFVFFGKEVFKSTNDKYDNHKPTLTSTYAIIMPSQGNEMYNKSPEEQYRIRISFTGSPGYRSSEDRMPEVTILNREGSVILKTKNVDDVHTALRFFFDRWITPLRFETFFANGTLKSDLPEAL